MSVLEQYVGKQAPYVMMGTSGTSGDLLYLSTGSALTCKSSANYASDNTNAFIGVLVDSTVKGTYGAVLSKGVVQLEKLVSTNKIELGNIVYADGAAKDNKVGTVAAGTAIGVCIKQSATSDTRVSVKLIPFYEMRGGFVAA